MAPSFRKFFKNVVTDLGDTISYKGRKLFNLSTNSPPEYRRSIDTAVHDDKQQLSHDEWHEPLPRRSTVVSEAGTVRTRPDVTLERQATDQDRLTTYTPVVERRLTQGTLHSLSTKPSASVNPFDVVRDGPVPRAVPCRLVVFLDKECHEHFEEFRLNWQDPSQYTLVERAARNILEAKHPSNIHFYKKAGRVRLIECAESGKRDEEKEKDSAAVESERQWKERVQIMVARYTVASYQISQRSPRFVLEARLEYGLLKVPAVSGVTYSATIRSILQVNSDENWEGKPYWPRKILQEVFTDGAIHQLLDEDKTLPKHGDYSMSIQFAPKRNIASKDDFAKLIGLYGVRLLATCIHQQIPLDCLYHLMADGNGDQHIPLKEAPAGWNDLGHWQRFKDNQGRFRPFDFPELDTDKKHYAVENGIVVPVKFNKDEDCIGEGAYGIVYKARIDGDHHGLAADKDTLFALKRFKVDHTSQNLFDEEWKVLEKLAKAPHPSITKYLASWVQDDRFYMLFPLAENGNLHDFLRTRPTPELTKDFVLWFLGQMEGIASALDHIHNLGRAGLGVADPSARHGKSKPMHTGYHHDLKPKNVLVSTDWILLISDFGTAKIHRLASGAEDKGFSHVTPNLTWGDEIYGAPDYSITGGTSRPYDVFSLGCIFLEMLLWAFDQGNLDAFFEERKLWSSKSTFAGNANFWYKVEGKKEWHLKAPVMRKLNELKYQTKRRGVFNPLVMLINDMLLMHPRARPDAAQVVSTLTGFVQQAKIDLSDPDFYKHKTSTSLKIYGIPSTASGEQSRPSSIDERLAEARQHNTDFLVPISPIRSRRRGSTSSLGADLDLSGLGLAAESSNSKQDTPNKLVQTPPHPPAVRKHMRQPSITCGEEILHRSPDASPSDDNPFADDTIPRQSISPSMNWFRSEDLDQLRRNSNESHHSIIHRWTV